MRNGLKWWQLGGLVLAGFASLGVQALTAKSVEHYTVRQVSTCTLASWKEAGDNNSLQGTFKCGKRSVDITDGTTLAQYLKSNHLVCTFKRGDLMHDELQECHG
jgi:hypothetical protein